MNKRLKNILLASATGLLYFLAFPPFEFSFCAWVAFVPLLFAVRNSSSRDIAWLSYFSGLVTFGLLLYWLGNVTVPGTIVLIFLLSIVFVLFGMVSGLVFKYSLNLFLLPFAWVVLEYIRANLLTGFPWGLLGYAQYKNLNLIQVSDITGAYGVSFIIMSFNVAFFSFLARYKRKISYLMTAMLFMIIATSYGIYRLNNFVVEGDVRISVVQGNIPQEFKWDAQIADEIVDKYAMLTAEAVKDKPDMIIWPETAYPYLVEGDITPGEGIDTITRGIDVPLLAGLVLVEGNDFYNSAILFNGKSGAVGVYRKTHLVPFGEYVPLEEYFSTFRDYVDKPMGDFKRGREYTLFSVRSLRSSVNASGARMRQISFYKFGVLICFEDIFPYLAREFVKDGARFLVNITNDAWFERTAAPRQHLQASVFRAVENRVPVIRAANTGISAFIDPTGRIISTLQVEGQDTFVTGTATADVNIYAVRSYYTVYGDNFVLFAAFMMILIFISDGFLYPKKD